MMICSWRNFSRKYRGESTRASHARLTMPFRDYEALTRDGPHAIRVPAHMKRSLHALILIGIVTTALAALPALAQRGTLIPRSVAGDQGKYYLLDAKRTGDI